MNKSYRLATVWTKLLDVQMFSNISEESEGVRCGDWIDQSSADSLKDYG